MKMGYMKDNSSKEKKKVLEDLYIIMTVLAYFYIKDNGNKTKKKDREQKLENKDNLKGFGNKIKKMGPENLNILFIKNMIVLKVNGILITRMEKDNCFLKMETY